MTIPRGLPVKHCIACHEHTDHGQHDQVAPIPSDDDLAQHDAADNNETREVDRGDNHRRQVARNRYRAASEKPQGEQPKQGPSNNRRPAGPIWHGRQQKSGDDRTQISEQHFMGMPGHGIERCRQFQSPRQHRHPKRHAQRRPRPPRREKTVGSRRRETRARTTRASAALGSSCQRAARVWI